MTAAATPHWRPRAHFSPRSRWINDPNGLIWRDGEYHLFFQFNPHGDTWGHMSWGHAVSSDLVHWQELPVALPEDDDWMVFSGSMVIDHANTAGFGDGTRAPMVAIYTGHGQRPPHRQTQQLAYSLDRGRTWARHAGNPVLDIGSSGFRDPKVFWHDGTRQWVMLVSMADEGWLRFFGSPDLKRWTPLSECRLQMPATCRIWECPDLLHVPVEGAAGERAWLLKFDVFEGHPSGGSGAVGVVGHFDGARFVPTQAPQWIDGGMDFYAAIAFAAMPPGDARYVWLGWMNDHRYAKATPTAPWRGAMTLPREVALRRTAAGLRVVQRPVAELASLRTAPSLHRVADRAFDTLELAAPGSLPVAHEIVLRVDALQARRWSLQVRAGGDEVTVVTVDRDRRELAIDRRRSGAAITAGRFLGEHRIAWDGAAAPVTTLRVIVDACSVEVFTDDGLAALTELVFPQPGSTGVRLVADAPVLLQAFDCWPLADAMPGRD